MTAATGFVTMGLVGIAALAGYYGAPPPPADKPVSGPPPGYALQQSFAEEFNGTAVDTSKWIFAFYNPATETPTVAKRSLWSNAELEVYFDKAFLGLGINPFKVSGGTLIISANPLSTTAQAAVLKAIDAQPSSIRNSALRQVRYSSGMISTRASYAQTYGYFEYRAKWSSGRGIWPAFWLLPQSGRWPPEIDILEAHGDKPTTAFQSVHSTVAIPVDNARDVTRKVALPSGTGQDFHTYGMLWTPKTIIYYIDGTKTATIATPSDMNVPMYLLANLAIGGTWPGNPDSNTKFPATLTLDYIRAWKFTKLP